MKRREKLKRSAVRFANAYWTILDDTMDAPRPSRPYSHARPPVPPQPRPPTATATATAAAAAAGVAAAAVVAASAADRPSTRRVSRAGVRNGHGDGGSGCRSSGRAAAAAARAAVAAIATAEALEDEEEFDRGVGVGRGIGEEREGERDAGGNGRGPEETEQGVRGGRANGSGRPKGGCAEQEHGWDMFAQLPALPKWSADRDVDQQERQRLVEKWEIERWRVDCGARTTEGNRGLFVHRGREEEDEIVDACTRTGNRRGVGTAERLLPWTHRIRKGVRVPTVPYQ